MANTHKAIREAVAARIEADRVNMPITDFVLKHTPIPTRFHPQDTESTCLVVVMTLGFNEDRATRGGDRMPVSSRDVTSQVFIQEKLRTTATGDFDESRVDLVLELREKISDVVKDIKLKCTPEGSYTWTSNFDMRDQMGLPYSYDLIRDSNMVQAYVNSIFTGAK